LNEKGVVIRGNDGTIAASGKLINDLYVLAIRVCIPHCKYGMNVLVIKINAML
jgi:hypothetical protein